MKFTTYTDIYNEYRNQYTSCVEEEYSWYKKADTLRDAVNKAFLSRNDKGEVENHQSHYGIPKCLPSAVEVALKYFDAQCITGFDDFKSIYKFVQNVRKEVTGFGELAHYDVTMRIAHYLGHAELQEVYLHADVKDGCRALGMNIRNRRTIPVKEFPAPFNQLDGDHLENLLCIYKDRLANPLAKVGKTCVRLQTNSSCISKKVRLKC
jgi:hypothetical protein